MVNMLPRHVSAASVDEGDTIRVTWKVGDVEHTRTGKVERIERSYGWIFYSPQGNEIARVTRDSRARVTLLATSSVSEPALFEV